MSPTRFVDVVCQAPPTNGWERGVAKITQSGVVGRLQIINACAERCLVVAFIRA